MKKLIAIGALLLAYSHTASAEYASWAQTETLSGTGSFPANVQMPSFTWSLSGDVNSFTIASGDDFDLANTFEDSFGDASSAGNINPRAEDNGSTPGQPIAKSLTLDVNFNAPTPDSRWGFALTDLDTDQVRVRAWDSSGTPVDVSVIASWFQGTFDASSADGTDGYPYWDPAEAALVGSTAQDSTTWHTVIDSTTGDEESPAGWFAPNIPLTRLTFEFQSINATGNPSFHAYFGARAPQAPPEYSPQPVPALSHPALGLLALMLAIGGLRARRARKSTPQ